MSFIPIERTVLKDVDLNVCIRTSRTSLIPSMNNTSCYRGLKSSVEEQDAREVLGKARMVLSLSPSDLLLNEARAREREKERESAISYVCGLLLVRRRYERTCLDRM